MTKFTYNDFRVLERCPSSPKNLQAGISHLQIYPDPCTIEGFEQVARAVEILDRDG